MDFICNFQAKLLRWHCNVVNIVLLFY